MIAVPLWEISHKLETLWLITTDGHALNSPGVGIESLEESTITAFNIPAEVPTDPFAIKVMHEAIASRMIVAAVRGGQLRMLEVGNLAVEAPFAVPALLPYWMSINTPLENKSYWSLAVERFPRILAHVSLWHGAAHGAARRKDRTLTRGDIQSLHSVYISEGVPEVEGIGVEDTTNERTSSHLLWLRDDAELAQQVADAWNAVVERGKLKDIKRYCERCSVPL